MANPNSSLRGVKTAEVVSSAVAIPVASTTSTPATTAVAAPPPATVAATTMAVPPLPTVQAEPPAPEMDLIVPDPFEGAEEYSHSLIVRCIAEFTATMLFVFIGVAQAGAINKELLLNASSNISMLHASDGITHSALAHGLAIFILVCVFGGISGAHMNPAVTFGVMLVGQIEQLTCLAYLCCQFGGALLGALIARGVMTEEVYNAVLGGCAVMKDHAWYQGLLGETLATFTLMLAVLTTAIDPKKNMFAPLAIGLAVSGGIFSIGHISGGAMNPARALGPNIVATAFLGINAQSEHIGLWTNSWLYFVGPCIGAGIAAALYRAFFANDERLLN